jgi:hypothetical protein
MRDETGRPTGKSHHLKADDNERVIASRFTLERWRTIASDFNRPLVYGPSGVA